MTLVALRTTASPAAGLGHLERSWAVGRALETQGHRTVYVVEKDSLGAERLAARGAGVELLTPEDSEPDRILALGPGIVSFDVGPTEHNRLVAYKESGVLVVTFDDLGDGRYLADLVVDPNLTEASNPRKIVTSTRFLLTPAHAILRPEVTKRIPRHRKTRDEIETVVVTFGGTDPEGLTARAVAALERLPERIRVVLAIGPGFAKPKALDKALLAARRDYEVSVAPDLPSLLLEADLGIVNAGMTLYESGALGLPTVAIAANKGELANLQQFEHAGAARSLGLAAHRPDAEMAAAVLSCEIPGIRAAMTEAGFHLVDGKGLDRLTAAVRERLAG